MNDHLAMLIYLTAARLRQQRLQAGTVGGLEIRPESHARMRWEGRAKPGQLLFTAAQSCLSLRHVRSRCPAASQAAWCYHFTPSAHSQHQQAPAAGGQGPPCRGLRREALARCCQIRRAWALPVVLHVHSAGLLGQRRLLAVPDFSGNLVVFIPWNSWKDSRAPGKREPGNPHPINLCSVTHGIGLFVKPSFLCMSTSVCLSCSEIDKYCISEIDINIPVS